MEALAALPESISRLAVREHKSGDNMQEGKLLHIIFFCAKIF